MVYKIKYVFFKISNSICCRFHTELSKTSVLLPVRNHNHSISVRNNKCQQITGGRLWKLSEWM